MRISPSLCLAFCLVAASSLAAAEPAALSKVLFAGKVSVQERLRFESVEQTGLRDAQALTLRTRLGYTTAPWRGWKAMIEAENIVAADGDRYSQSGLNPGGAGRAVIADPETTEINQVLTSCSWGKTTATVGRQRLVFDQARFIGDVGWRQNMQTFDAIVLQNLSVEKTTVTYAYVDRVNRVFGREHPQGRWDSASHLFNISTTRLDVGTVNAYAYLLDFGNAAANSCATSGVSLAGRGKISEALHFTYRGELAHQSDYGSNALNYTANYAALEVGLAAKSIAATLGYELLGSSRRVGFRTPLATLHAFNGWADLFLSTPAAGLRDVYAKVTASLPGGFSVVACYHQFEGARGGANFGDELDLQIARKFAQRFTATAKYADFRRDSPAFADVRKLWLQVDFAY